MKKTITVVALGSFLAILLFGVFAIAGTPHEKGVAAVAVNRAIVEVGADAPELKDTTNRFFNEPTPIEVAELPENDPETHWVETSTPFTDGITVNICGDKSCVASRGTIYATDGMRTYITTDLCPIDHNEAHQVTIQNGPSTYLLLGWYSRLTQPGYLFIVDGVIEEPASALFPAESVPPRDDPERRRLNEELSVARTELAEEREKNLAQAYTIAQLKIGLAKSVPIGPAGLPNVPLPAGETPIVYEPFELLCHTAEGEPGKTWCVPCNSYHDGNGDGDDRASIEYTHEKPPQIWDAAQKKFRQAGLPTTSWHNAKGELRAIEGYWTLDQILAEVMKPENMPSRKVRK